MDQLKEFFVAAGESWVYLFPRPIYQLVKPRDLKISDLVEGLDQKFSEMVCKQYDEEQDLGEISNSTDPEPGSESPPSLIKRLHPSAYPFYVTKCNFITASSPYFIIRFPNQVDGQRAFIAWNRICR